MCPNLSQPEEIDLILKEIENFDMQVDWQVTGIKPLSKASQEGWNGSYGSPYRAAYMKAHRLER